MSSKSKFSSPAAARIYRNFTAEEEITTTIGVWLGMYVSDKPGGVILHEDALGFVSMEVHGSKEALELAWRDYESLYVVDPDADEPADDDYVIDMARMTVKGLPGLPFEDYEDAILAINLQMQEDQFYPDVWTLSDHGNFLRMDDFQDEVIGIMKSKEDGISGSANEHPE